MMISRDALEASITRDSFHEFVLRFWDTFIPEKLVHNWHIEVLCETLQDVAERLFRGEPKKHDLVINIPPGTSKSSVASIMFPAWVWTKMPTARSLCASYSYPLALDLSRKSRDVVQSEKWIRLFGDVELREDQNSKGYFVNKHGGMRYAVGTDGTITGFHGHFLIVDDPIDPRRVASEAELKSANSFVTETLGSRKVNKETSVTILIMQRLHQNDPSAVLLEMAERGNPVRHINLPAEITGSGMDVVRPRKYAKCYKEGLLDPTRLNRKVLEATKVTLGQFGYAGQMLQNPVPLGGGMFKVDRLLVDVPPPLASFKSLVRGWDKAGTRGGGAYTAGVLIGRDAKDHFWVLDVVRGQWDSNAREKVIKQTAILDGKRTVVGLEQEPGSGGKESAQATLRNLAGWRVRIERPTGEKTIRADPYSVQVNGGNVSIKAGLWSRAYIDELQFFPFSTYKDQVDASSIAFSLLTQTKTRVGGLSAYGSNRRLSSWE